MITRFLLAAAALAAALPATAALHAYPQPAAAVEASPFYTVRVGQADHWQAGFVHVSHARTEGPGTEFVKGRTLSYVGFACDGPTTVEVHLRENALVPPGPATIRPLRHRLAAQVVDDRTLRFTVPGPGQYTVEFGERGYQHGLVVAADPLETDRPDPARTAALVLADGSSGDPTPQLAGKKLLYFRRGVHEIGGGFKLPAHVTEVYLEPGALVHGAIYVGHSEVRLHGRGVLSGVKLPHRAAHLIETPSAALHVAVDGLFMADYPMYAIRTLGRHNSVTWVKCVGAWLYNADGLVAWDGTRLAHSFIHADDDAIKLYGSDVTVENCVIWQMTNGACLQLGWSSLEGHRVRVRGIDVVRTEWRGAGDGANNSVVNLRLPIGGDKRQSDFLIENVTVETPSARIFDLRFRDKKPAKDGKIDGGEHRLENLVFRNFTVVMPEPRATRGGNLFQPYDATHGYKAIRFENLRVNGRLITEENHATDGQFTIPPESKPEITFHP